MLVIFDVAHRVFIEIHKKLAHFLLLVIHDVLNILNQLTFILKLLFVAQKGVER
jgi:hypothetical protein